MKLLIDDTYINMIEDRILFLEEQMRTMKCNEKAWQKEERENEYEDIRKAVDTIRQWNVNAPIVKKAKGIAIASMITTSAIFLEKDLCYKNYEMDRVTELNYLLEVYEQNLIDKGVK